MEKVYMHSMGCTENLLDAQKYYDFLVLNDYEMTEVVEEADIIVLITCGVTSYVSDECCSVFDTLVNTKRSDARMFVGGCLPVIEQEKVKKFNATFFRSNNGDVSTLAEAIGMKNYKWTEEKYGHQFYSGIGNRERKKGAVSEPKGLMKKLVDYEKAMEPAYVALGLEPSDYFHQITEEHYNRAYFVHVARGCGGNCTYCAIKFVKGDIVSKDIATIKQEVEKGISEGYKDIVLAGDDVGSYGRDLGVDFYALMMELNKIEADIKITVRNFEPFWFVHNREKMSEILAGGKIRTINIPIQSGNNEVLARMGRRYTVDVVMEGVEALKELFPDVIFSTHIMVGFPGETVEQFEETLKTIEKGSFDFLRYSMYTERPNTPASKMEDKISYVQKAQRMNQLEQMVCKLEKLKSEKQIKCMQEKISKTLGEIIYGE